MGRLKAQEPENAEQFPDMIHSYDGQRLKSPVSRLQVATTHSPTQLLLRSLSYLSGPPRVLQRAS